MDETQEISKEKGTERQDSNQAIDACSEFWNNIESLTGSQNMFVIY